MPKPSKRRRGATWGDPNAKWGDPSVTWSGASLS